MKNRRAENLQLVLRISNILWVNGFATVQLETNKKSRGCTQNGIYFDPLSLFFVALAKHVLYHLYHSTSP
jgi:hypothetical protein